MTLEEYHVQRYCLYPSLVEQYITHSRSIVDTVCKRWRQNFLETITHPFFTPKDTLWTHITLSQVHAAAPLIQLYSPKSAVTRKCVILHIKPPPRARFTYDKILHVTNPNSRPSPNHHCPFCLLLTKESEDRAIIWGLRMFKWSIVDVKTLLSQEL